LNNWAKFLTLNNIIEAEILRSYLESYNVKVLLKCEAIGQLHGLTTGPLAEVEIWVPAGKLREAKELLEGFNGNGDRNNSY